MCDGNCGGEVHDLGGNEVFCDACVERFSPHAVLAMRKAEAVEWLLRKATHEWNEKTKMKYVQALGLACGGKDDA